MKTALTLYNTHFFFHFSVQNTALIQPWTCYIQHMFLNWNMDIYSSARQRSTVTLWVGLFTNLQFTLLFTPRAGRCNLPTGHLHLLSQMQAGTWGRRGSAPYSWSSHCWLWPTCHCWYQGWELGHGIDIIAFFLHCEGSEALAQAVQSSCKCPIPGGV